MQTLFNAKKYFYLSDYTSPTQLKTDELGMLTIKDGF